MPLAPPVTTTILPVTCIAASAVLKSISGQNEIEYGGVMAGRAEQHEGVPDRVLKTQPLPGMKDYAEAVERSARDHEPKRQAGKHRGHGVIEHGAAPAHRQIEADRDAVVAARQRELQHDSDNRPPPHA